jgi:hypothetical protein
MKLEVEDWDYDQAIQAVDKLLSSIYCSCEGEGKGILQDMPSSAEIVDAVIDKII